MLCPTDMCECTHPTTAPCCTPCWQARSSVHRDHCLLCMLCLADMCARAPYYDSLLRTVHELIRHPAWAAQLLTDSVPGGHTLLGVLSNLAGPAARFIKVSNAVLLIEGVPGGHALLGVLSNLAGPAARFIKLATTTHNINIRCKAGNLFPKADTYGWLSVAYAQALLPTCPAHPIVEEGACFLIIVKGCRTGLVQPSTKIRQLGPAQRCLPNDN
eukprot:1162040-Pelagomonas_calceolata.AAC.6